MQRTMLKSKIHRATVTDANLHYQGSVTIDPHADGGGRHPASTSGWRSTTSPTASASRPTPSPARRARARSCINGAAAHKARSGDLVILGTYADYDATSSAGHTPSVVFVDARNRRIPAPEPALVDCE